MEFASEIRVVIYLDELGDPLDLGDQDDSHRITRDFLQYSSDELEEFVKARYF